MEPVVGIIAEYNPFHNGHFFHLNEAKKRSGAETVVVVMSGDFVQRGEAAILDKWARAETAIDCGADLVLEMPFVFACNNAEYFARGGVAMLHALGCVTHLAFGCETDNPELLSEAAELLYREGPEFRQVLHEELDKGLSFPMARAMALGRCGRRELQDLLDGPNNILGVEYLKQCIRFTENRILPLPIQRVGPGHRDLTMPAAVAGAGALRRLIRLQGTEAPDLETRIPLPSISAIRSRCTDQDRAEDALYRILTAKLLTTSAKEIEGIFSAGEGLENRLKQAAVEAEGWESLLKAVKSKRYTETRIRRLMIHTVVGLTREKMQEFLVSGPGYLRVLGCSSKGTGLLRKMKENQTATLPILTNINKERLENGSAQDMLEYDLRASNIFNLCTGIALRSNSDHCRKPYIAGAPKR